VAYVVANLLFRHKNNKLQVDLGDLSEEKQHLTEFLKSTLKVEVSSNQGKLELDSEKIQPQELQRVVTKFVYKRNLNSAYWVSMEGSTAKINRFKGAKKPEKDKKKSSGHQSITQSWGL
jgi:phosphoribosylformylglycinamidine (FGAM) synthase-like amidotransferase family enzyme